VFALCQDVRTELAGVGPAVRLAITPNLFVYTGTYPVVPILVWGGGGLANFG